MATAKTYICPECSRLTTRRRCPADDTPTVPSELVKNPEKMDPLVGTLIDDKFHVKERLARGGMANVYRVIHQKTDAELALKVLSRILVEDLTAVRRFYKEARLAATLRHPNTVRVFDVGNTDDGACYMAMEFLEGLSLGQAFRGGASLPVPRVIHIISQILRSLGEAHDTGLVHRDLKPDNIFLINHYGVPDFVKVLDFGIAKAIRDESEQLTQTGTVVGTPRYMSPEQAQGKSLDQRSDLYSLGVILYELLAGKPPFNDEIPVRLLMMHINDPPVSLEVVRPDINPGLCKLVMDLLEKNEEDRPNGATEVIARINALHVPPWIGHPEAEELARKEKEKSAEAKRKKKEAATNISPPSHVDTKALSAPDTEEIDPEATVTNAAVPSNILDDTDTRETDPLIDPHSIPQPSEREIPEANDLVVVVQPAPTTKAKPRKIGIYLFALILGIVTVFTWQKLSTPNSNTPVEAPRNIEAPSTEETGKAVIGKDVQSSEDSEDITQKNHMDARAETGSTNLQDTKSTPDGIGENSKVLRDSQTTKDVLTPNSGLDVLEKNKELPILSNPVPPQPKKPTATPKTPSKPNGKQERRRPKGPRVWSID